MNLNFFFKFQFNCSLILFCSCLSNVILVHSFCTMTDGLYGLFVSVSCVAACDALDAASNKAACPALESHYIVILKA